MQKFSKMHHINAQMHSWFVGNTWFVGKGSLWTRPYWSVEKHACMHDNSLAVAVARSAGCATRSAAKAHLGRAAQSFQARFQRGGACATQNACSWVARPAAQHVSPHNRSSKPHNPVEAGSRARKLIPSQVGWSAFTRASLLNHDVYCCRPWTEVVKDWWFCRGHVAEENCPAVQHVCMQDRFACTLV